MDNSASNFKLLLNNSQLDHLTFEGPQVILNLYSQFYYPVCSSLMTAKIVKVASFDLVCLIKDRLDELLVNHNDLLLDCRELHSYCRPLEYVL